MEKCLSLGSIHHSNKIYRHTDRWKGREGEGGGGEQRETETDTVTSSDQDWKMEVSISQANSIELRKFPAGALEPF